MRRKRMGELLVEGKLLNQEQLDEALEIVTKSGNRLGNVLVEMELATVDDIRRTLSKQLRIPMISLDGRKISEKVLERVPAALCRSKKVIPVGFRNREFWVAMHDPTDYGTVDEISFIVGSRVKVCIAREQEILDYLMRFHSSIEDTAEGFDTNEYVTDSVQVVEHSLDYEDITDERLERAAKGGVIRQLTNGIIVNAIRRDASDIHIEPQEEDVAVRYRIDGMMHDIMNFGKISQAPAISRIKIMANLDITIRTKPQDGRSRVRIGEAVYDLRVSILPTFYGEKIVMRILEPAVGTSISDLGMPPKELTLLEGHAGKTPGTDSSHRSHGKRKDHHPIYFPQVPPFTGYQHCYHRGSDRILHPGHQSGSGESFDRPYLCQRSPIPSATRPEYCDDRRDPRSGNGNDRFSSGPNRPFGAKHPSHQQCRGCCYAPSGYRY